ncbi:MAG: hypothetical protein IJT70_05335 [Clostridia bacterium]|nr:hypothetical protein [Clostridia bacterium]
MKKITALVMVIVLAFAVLASCGGAKGEEKTQGNITVFVPDGYGIDGGIMSDDNYARIFNPELEISNNMGISVVESVDKALENISLYQGDTPGTDVSIKAGDIEWKGVSYEVLGSTYTDVYATIGGKVVYSHSCGFSEENLNAILASIKIA